MLPSWERTCGIALGLPLNSSLIWGLLPVFMWAVAGLARSIILLTRPDRPRQQETDHISVLWEFAIRIGIARIMHFGLQNQAQKIAKNITNILPKFQNHTSISYFLTIFLNFLISGSSPTWQSLRYRTLLRPVWLVTTYASASSSNGKSINSQICVPVR